MLYITGLYISLALFAAGIIYKIISWFTRRIGADSNRFSAAQRISEAFKGAFRTIFSGKVATLIKTFILDVVIQRKIYKINSARWFMHSLMFYGFMGLLIFHGLQRILAMRYIEGYYPRLNPFMFLRDLMGVLILVGLLFAIVRRFIMRLPRRFTGFMDSYLIVIIFVIIFSGVVLEGIKITSHTAYTRMLNEYSPSLNADQKKKLEAYWVNDYGLVSTHILPFDKASLAEGKKISAENCAGCHSRPIWSFSGFAAANAIKPAAHVWDRHNIGDILFNLHLLACFAALAYLPFSKFFHFFATPLSLLVNSVMNEGRSHPANMVTKRIIELDACIRCTACSSRCSAIEASVMTGNSYILPSVKMAGLHALARGKKPNDEVLRALAEGVYICTNCDRCTVVCPAGIDLKELWFQVREELIRKRYPLPVILTPLSYYRGLRKKFIDRECYGEPVNRAREALTGRLDGIYSRGDTVPVSALDRGFMDELGLSADAAAYTHCFTCSSCSAACPVVNAYENPMERLGLLPHQVIQSAVLGLGEHALGSKMIWDCVTCYKCQEKCPQGVRVTEVFYKLKNLAASRTATRPEAVL